MAPYLHSGCAVGRRFAPPFQGSNGGREVSAVATVPAAGTQFREIPSPTAESADGSGRLSVNLVRGRSVASEVHSRNPFRWLVPRGCGKSVWAFASSYGGGLVSGDAVSLQVECGPGSSSFVGSQASTKVYQSGRAGGVRHNATVNVGAGAFLAWLPDVLQPFGASEYEQRQRFNLTSSSGLVVLDWFCSGRMARGERWRFARYATRTEIWNGALLSMVDALRLEDPDGVAMKSLGNSDYECFATLVVCGGMLAREAERVSSEVARRPLLRQPEVTISAGAVRGGGVLVRCGGVGVEEVRNALGGFLGFLEERLGENPLLRRN